MNTDSLRVEDQLLILVARLVIDTGAKDQIHQLLERNQIDWEYLMNAANRNGLGNLLCFQFQSSNFGPLPAEIISQCRYGFQEAAKYCLSLTGALTRLVELLQGQGIDCVPFKGPTLGLLAYQDIALRQFSDLDIFIHQGDMLRAKKALAHAGYSPTSKFSPARESALLRFSHAYSFQNDAGIFLDLHWDLVEPAFALPLDLKAMWQRRTSVMLEGREIPTFVPEDLLLILCIHGFSHSWERLGWICDVAGLIMRQNEIKWPEVLCRARAGGLERILLLGLLLANELLHAPVPAEASALFQKHQTVRSTAARIATDLFGDRRRAGLIDSIASRMRMRERKQDQLRTVVRFIATPGRYDWMCTSLPDSLLSLYYLVRPIRLAGKYALGVSKTPE